MRTSIEHLLDAAIVFAAVATIPLVVAQAQGATDEFSTGLDWVIWSIFGVEYVVRTALAPQRWRFARRHWFSVALLLLTFPLAPLPDVLDLTRSARLIRVALLAARAYLAIRRAVTSRGLPYVFGITIVFVVTAGALLTAIEPETVGGDVASGIWWAAVTITTVGYGDITPASPGGRILGLFVMVGGVALTSILAATLAAHLVQQDEGSELAAIHARLDLMEAHLADLIAAGTSPAPQSTPPPPETNEAE